MKQIAIMHSGNEKKKIPYRVTSIKENEINIYYCRVNEQIYFYTPHEYFMMNNLWVQYNNIKENFKKLNRTGPKKGLYYYYYFYYCC